MVQVLGHQGHRGIDEEEPLLIEQVFQHDQDH